MNGFSIQDQKFYKDKSELLGEALNELMEVGGPEASLMAIYDEIAQWITYHKKELEKWQRLAKGINFEGIKCPASSEVVN